MNELAYQINPQATLDHQCLVLDLLEVKKEGFSFQILPASPPRSASYWRGLTRPGTDQELFQFLLKEELAFQQKVSGRSPSMETFLLQQLHISPPQTLAAFQLLSPSQKLFCQGKALVIDLFGRAEFYYEAALLANNNQLEITGKVRWRDSDFPLSECTALGPGHPPWFVRGIQLKMIGTSISWKTLRPYRSSPSILEGIETHRFLEKIDPQDPDTPQLIWISSSPSLSFSPSPRLLLKDPWGAFANLEMDYGQGYRIAFHDRDPSIRDSQGRALFKRLLEEEAKWEKDLLETDFIKKKVETTHYYCPLDRVAKSLTFLLEIGWQIQDGQGRRLLKETGWALDLEERSNSLLLKGSLRYQDHQVDLQSVVGAFNRRERFIQLSPDIVGLLPTEGPSELLKELAEESEWVQEGALLKKSQFGTLGALWEEIPPSSSPSLVALRDRWQNFKGIQEALPSPAFQGTLRPYQQEGVNWLSFLYDYGFHGMLADEMGLGKTIQVLAFLSRLSPQPHPHLIVMPTSLLFNWRHELSCFLPSLPLTLHHGPDRSRDLSSLQKAALILTSYTTLRLDLPLFQSLSYSCLILDEAQIIKNADTQIAHCVCRLQAQMKLSLTGTPIENRLQELWSHFRFLIPELLGSRESFDATLQAAQADRRHLERMKRKVFPFLLRRCKKEVAKDLPARLDQTVWIEMEEEQRELYDQVLAGFKKGLLKKVELEGVKKHRLEILQAILRLRQICCHPLLVASLGEKPVEKSAKFTALFQDLETLLEDDHKVLVYSQFTSMLKWMTQEAHQREWSYSYLDGATTNREEKVRQFQDDPHCRLFFISLKAGGVGLNLTAADDVYLYDPWWNEAVEEQAIHRAHRIGREKTVVAKRLVIRESIEEKMMRLKEVKRGAMADLFTSDRVPDSLTLEDLEFLLN